MEVVKFNDVKLKLKDKKLRIKEKSEDWVEVNEDDLDFIMLDTSQMSELIDCLIQIDEASKRIKEITGLDYSPELLGGSEEDE